MNEINGVIKYFTFDELLPQIDRNAQAYAESVNNGYIVGIEFNNETFPIQFVTNAGDADSLVSELSKSLEYHFGDVPTFDEDESALLEGFTFVPNRGMSSILIGKRNRLYLKGDLKSQLDIVPGRRVLIAFNPAEKAFAIVKPSAKAVTDDMRAAGYFVSNRKDVTCAKLFHEFHLDRFEGETFYADTSSLSGNVVIFRK